MAPWTFSPLLLSSCSLPPFLNTSSNLTDVVARPLVWTFRNTHGPISPSHFYKLLHPVGSRPTLALWKTNLHKEKAACLPLWGRKCYILKVETGLLGYMSGPKEYVSICWMKKFHFQIGVFISWFIKTTLGKGRCSTIYFLQGLKNSSLPARKRKAHLKAVQHDTMWDSLIIFRSFSHFLSFPR